MTDATVEDGGRIRLGISACLLGQSVRWDGGHAHDRFLTDTLGRLLLPQLFGIPQRPNGQRKLDSTFIVACPVHACPVDKTLFSGSVGRLFFLNR